MSVEQVISGLERVVDATCAAPWGDLPAAELQAAAVALRRAAGRLEGSLDEVLAALDACADGMVQINAVASRDTDSGAAMPAAPGVPADEGLSLFAPVRVWWRERVTISRGQASRDLRRAEVASRLTVIRDAVTEGVLSPAQAAVLYRLDGKIPLMT